MYQAMNADEWAEVLAPAAQWEIAYPVAQDQAMSWLDAQPLGIDTATVDLMEALFPVSTLHTPEHIAARKRLQRALQVKPPAPIPLDTYRRQGPEEPMFIYGKRVMGHRMIWSRPEPARNNLAQPAVDPDAALLGE